MPTKWPSYRDYTFCDATSRSVCERLPANYPDDLNDSRSGGDCVPERRQQVRASDSSDHPDDDRRRPDHQQSQLGHGGAAVWRRVVVVPADTAVRR